ncbi:unnamed protein product [Moneuplotes crassus]|uniref:1-alkyl-2-acetylglycerophosphocholine esterase n=1 Tax=Euplotes crassus TaxID=5936 RepID=A0AAD1UEZ9_EUPCR|nr:unnamed protein product [Moneuplotes crassus]
MGVKYFANHNEKWSYCLFLLLVLKDILSGPQISGLLGFSWCSDQLITLMLASCLLMSKVFRLGVAIRFNFVLFYLLCGIIMGLAPLLTVNESTGRLVMKLVGLFLMIVLPFTAKFFTAEAPGPYCVGVKDLIIKGKTTPSVMIFYPMDKKEYDQKITSDSNKYPVIIDGDESNPSRVAGLRLTHDISTTSKFALSFVPSNFWVAERLMDDDQVFNIEAVVGGNLHKDFASRLKKLTPVIYCGGLAGIRIQSSFLFRYLASYGCIVYTISHTDGSSCCYKDLHKDPNKFVQYNHFSMQTHTDSFGKKYTHEEFRRISVANRVKDIETVIEYIKTESMQEFQSIDMSKLTVIGHSLGGMTMIDSSHKLPDTIKACVAFDPHLLARRQEILEESQFYLKQPTLVINSELFKDSPFLADFDSKACMDKFKRLCDSSKDTDSNNKKQNFWVNLEDSGHLSFLDVSQFSPGPLAMTKTIGSPDNASYVMNKNHSIVLDFMSRNNLLPVEFDNPFKIELPTSSSQE